MASSTGPPRTSTCSPTASTAFAAEAASAVEAALAGQADTAERQGKTAGLSEVFEGMGDGLAEWIITTPGGAQLLLQMA